MHGGNPGFCPQLWPCWHHGHFPWSIPLAMNLVKTQMLSDPMQPFTLPLSLQCHASALSLWLVHRSCVVAFPDTGAPSVREGLGGFCLDLSFVLNIKCGYVFVSERDRNTGLWHSTSAHSLWSGEDTRAMISPEGEAPLDVMGVGHQVNCFDSDATFMKSHFRERDIHVVHVCGKMGCTSGLRCKQ